MNNFNHLFNICDSPPKLLKIAVSFFILLFSPVFLSFASAAPKFDKTGNQFETVPMVGIQQGIQITGTVIDIDGNTLPGASVVVKGTLQGSVTDINGGYSLQVPNENATLVFSFVGFTEQEIMVGNQRVINVTLSEGTKLIEEIVVVGYGTQKKANLTGAVSIVSSDKLDNRPMASSGHGLQGLVPNLNVTFNDGDPTTAASFNVRGYTSINGGGPLILVDGVPMDLDRINPSDIASVTVLKDAASAAIYGSRAGFGVILVETKKGKSKKAVVTFSAEQSWAKSIFHYDPVTDPYEFMIWRNKAQERVTGSPQFSQTRLDRAKAWSENPTFENAWTVNRTTNATTGQITAASLDFNGYNDYKNKLLNEFAPQQKYDMSVSKATDDASFYASFGFINKDGFLKIANENYKRYNALLKADIKVSQWLNMDSRVVFSAEVSDKPHAYGVNNVAGLHSVVRVNPLQAMDFPDLPYYVEPGDHEKYSHLIGMGFYNGDMVNILRQSSGGDRTNFFRGDLTFTQGVTLTPMKGLRIRGDFTFRPTFRKYSDVATSNYYTTTNLLANDMMLLNANSNPEFIRNENDLTKNYQLNAYAEYETTLAGKHYVKGMAGINQDWRLYEYNWGRGNDLMSQNLTTINLTTGTQSIGGSANHYALRGVFFRLNYIFDERYLIELNGRYDGTSRFKKDARFGFFPSASVAWRVSQESFMEGASNWLDNLKIRVSYGELGNQIIRISNTENYYPYINSMSQGTSVFRMDGSGELLPTIQPPALTASTLTWEDVTTRNIGIDLLVLKQRLEFNFDLYARDTKGMLMRGRYPDILGADAPWENGANLTTKGWELSLTWRDRIGTDWNYDLTFSMWDSQTEITKFFNENNSIPTGTTDVWRKGAKTGDIWGYKTLGFFQSDDEYLSHADQQTNVHNSIWYAGDIKYADLNGDNVISQGGATLENSGDWKVIGNSTARYSFGLYPKLSYKNWSIDLFFQGILKKDYMPSGGSWTNFFPYVSTAYIDKSWIKDSWTEDNRDAYFYAPYNANTWTNKNTRPQTRYLQNASYIRLKTLTLAYRIPKQWSEKIGINNAQVYAAGMNLWEFTKMRKPYDPENTSSDAATVLYPLQRIFSIGLKVSL